MSITATEARKMIESQVSLKEKMRRADHIIWNNGDRAVLIDQARFSVALWQGQTWTKKQRH
jgi:dephospho-CoA kinase